ncbi:putative glycosyl [Erysiphe necator]|uniref:Putative glycosyl n=1 Tax=Uncinula necator TaxID=52586 RepID=A0A0B1NX76_UNCNE|nr:putative glycosyl [Erysiphe necator]
MEQITILIITFDKIQKTLSNEWQSEVVMHNKIISACKDIEACKMACYRPSLSVSGLILDLKSGVEIYNKPLPRSITSTYHTESLEKPPSDSNTLLIIRDGKIALKLVISEIGNKRIGSGKVGQTERYHDRSEKSNQSSRRQQNNKPGWICKQVGCWSNKHSTDERAAHKKSFIARLNNRARQYFGEMDDENDCNIDVEALIQDIEINDNESSENYTETFLTSSGVQISDQSSQNIIEALAAESNQHLINTISSNSPKVYDAASLISRYSAEVFRGILIDSGAASFSTAGFHQYEA